MRRTISNFQGIAPKISPDKLPTGGAQTAENCFVGGGDLRPINKPLRIAKLGTLEYQSLFKYTENGTSHWVALADDVDVVQSPLNQDTYERLYFSGQTEPRVFANDIVSATFDPSTDYYKLGIPAPTAAPTVARSGSVTRYYTYTFVNAYGEEGPPSPTAGGTDVAASPVGLSAIENAPATRRVTALRFYRTAVGTAGTAEYRYVLEATWFSTGVSYSVGQFVVYSGTLYKCTSTHAAGAWNAGHFTAGDDVADAALGELLTTTYYDPPPAGLKGFILHPGGFVAGFKGNVLYLSEPYLPYAWPESYQKPVGGTIVGIGIEGDTIIVLTDGHPYFFSGSLPDQMTKTLHAKFVPCLSKRSIVSTDKGVFFASLEGLMLATLSGIDNMTKDIFRSDQWQAYYPSAIHGNYYQGRYYGWYSSGTDEGAIVLDLENGNVTTLTLKAFAGYIATDGKYYVIMEEDGAPTSRAIKQWEGDPYNYLPYNWKSGKDITDQRIAYTAARVYIDNEFYDVVMDAQEEAGYLLDLNEDLFDDSTPVITGNASTFTGESGDTLNITLNGILYEDISVESCTDIAGVASMINVTIGTVRASESTGGFLTVTGGINMMNVTIADGTNTAQTVVGELFSDAGNRQDGGATLGGSFGLDSFGARSFGRNAIISTEDIEVNNYITFRLFADGVQRAEKSVSGDNIFRIPAGYRGKVFEQSIAGNIPIRKTDIGTSASALNFEQEE